MKKNVLIGGAVLASAFVLVAGTATAASQITAHQLGTGAANHRVIQNGAVHNSDLTGRLSRLVHEKSTVPGPKGAKGDTGLTGAIFRVENYQNGGGGSATVACADDEATSQKYTAIAGGVQGSVSNARPGGGTESQSGFLVSSSFPGRMDWTTGVPKPNRLDGWIVLGNSQYTDTLKVWALCVPNTDISVQQVDLDN